MTEQMNATTSKGMSRRIKWLITLLIIGASAGFMWSQLPRGGFPGDLSLIGQGRPAVVLVRDHSYMGGMEVMDLLRQVRGDYPGVKFLVASHGTPEGLEFARQLGVSDGTVLLFAADGAPVAMARQPESTAELRELLSQVVQQP